MPCPLRRPLETVEQQLVGKTGRQFGVSCKANHSLGSIQGSRLKQNGSKNRGGNPSWLVAYFSAFSSASPFLEVFLWSPLFRL